MHHVGIVQCYAGQAQGAMRLRSHGSKSPPFVLRHRALITAILPSSQPRLFYILSFHRLETYGFMLSNALPGLSWRGKVHGLMTPGSSHEGDPTVGHGAHHACFAVQEVMSFGRASEGSPAHPIWSEVSG